MEIRRKSIPGSGNSLCKGPELADSVCLAGSEGPGAGKAERGSGGSEK